MLIMCIFYIGYPIENRFMMLKYPYTFSNSHELNSIEGSNIYALFKTISTVKSTVNYYILPRSSEHKL